MPIFAARDTQVLMQGQVSAMDSVNASQVGLPGFAAAGRGNARHAALLARPSLAIRAGIMPWVPVWLSLGIGGWFLLPHEPGARFYLSLAILGAALALAPVLMLRLAESGRLSWDWLDRGRIAALALLLAVAGAELVGLRAHMVAAPVLDFRYYGPVEGRVIGIDRSSGDRIRLLLDQVGLRDMAPWRVPKRVRISLMSEGALPLPGQRVMLTAHLGPPNGPAEPGGFDFRRVAWFQQLGAVGYSRTEVMSVAAPESGGALALHRLRLGLAQGMRDAIGGQAGAVSAALMTGDRSGIAEHTNQIMRDSNLYHIVSISGLHMSMLAGFVYAALRIFGAVLQALAGLRAIPVHKLAAGGALLASLLYFWLSGGGVATERAFIMVAVMLLAIIADRRAVSLRTVAVAAALILVLGPEGLTEAGFQMSFAATVALILMSEPWMRHAQAVPRWLRPVLMLVASSLIAGLATAPIAAAHFGRMTQYGLLANLLVVPVVGAVVMPGGVIAGLLAPLGLAQPALWFMGLGTEWMLLIAEWISGLQGAVMLVPQAPRATLPLMGLGAALLLLGPADASACIRQVVLLRRGAGAGLLAMAFLLWQTHQRPGILISAEGDAVAIMTPQGRVPSKPAGGSFVIANWLEADGDPADQATAAARPLWSGPNGNRLAVLDDGALTIRHITGKAAQGDLTQYCGKNAIIVLSSKVNHPDQRRACTILDIGYLRKSGAISIDIAAGAVKAKAIGDRIWSERNSRVHQGA